MINQLIDIKNLKEHYVVLEEIQTQKYLSFPWTNKLFSQ